MASSEALSRLHNLASETEHLAVHMGQADDALLIGLSVDHKKFKKAATKIRHQIDGKRHLSRVESTRATIIAEKTIRKMSTLKKNLSLIFQGPTASALDNARNRTRMKQTTLRCARIRSLRPDSVISWAAALPITDWKSDGMSNEVFDFLTSRIEAAGEVQPWPPVVREILRIFQLEVMPHSEEYNKFIDNFEHRTPRVQRIEVSSLLRTD
ncbi:hypothetical protein EG328_002513 [Venturia inaequalis]|uniref:Uncharacterized protein n=1 Tax=Venturia inaequalis TaxID=5025 RepID=A0A8H3VIC1_VENIN|nr:hypothetical protein EG328_002513 [Venturia inaequalis]